MRPHLSTWLACLALAAAAPEAANPSPYIPEPPHSAVPAAPSPAPEPALKAPPDPAAAPAPASPPVHKDTLLSNLNQTTEDVLPLYPSLGGGCNGTADCKANFSSCVKSVCSCDAGYLPSNQMLQCLPEVTVLEKECSEDVQCRKLEGSCINFKCSCPLGKTRAKGVCIKEPELDGPCETTTDCPDIPYSVCKDSVCVCTNGYIPNVGNNLCLPVMLRLGVVGPTVCQEDSQCQSVLGEEAICNMDGGAGKCDCRPYTHPFRDKCILFKVLEAECSEDGECLSEHQGVETPESRICSSGKCVCGPGWSRIGANFCISGSSNIRISTSLLALGLLLLKNSGFLFV